MDGELRPHAVRPATTDDAREIARVQVQGWREAYTGRMPASILDALDVDSSESRWRDVLTTQVVAGRAQLWVAELRGEVVGFACSGESQDDDAVAGRVQLYAIYVLAAHYGSGVGQALLDAAIGRAAASLWVLQDNPRAWAFYRRNGFRPDGRVQDDDRWGESVREARLVRDAIS